MLDLACCVFFSLSTAIPTLTAKCKESLFHVARHIPAPEHTVPFSKNSGFLRLISKPFVFWYAFLCAFCLTTVTQPYFPFYALFSDRFQFSFEGLPKPGICIRVNANETGPRIAFPQGNGVCFAVRLFLECHQTRCHTHTKPQDCVYSSFCVALRFDAWIQTLTPNYILGASSKSHCRLRKNIETSFWSTSCPDIWKVTFHSPNAEMAIHFLFPFQSLLFTGSVFLKTWYSSLKSHIPKRNFHTYRHWGWTPQYPIRFRQSNLSEPEENEMDWEKALRSCDGTVFTPLLRKTLSMPADFYTTFSSRKRFLVLKKHLPFSFKGKLSIR